MKNKLFAIPLLLATTLFADTVSITEAYDFALENSKTIKSAKYQLEANKQSIEQVKAEFYPQINGTISYSNTKEEINSLQNRLDYDIEEDSTDLMVSLHQVIYDPQSWARLGIEQIRAKMHTLSYEQQKQELAKVVLKDYINVLKSTNKIVLLNAYVKYNKSKLDAIEKRLKMNLASKMDFLQIKVEYNTAKLELSKEKSLYKVYKVRLENITAQKDLQIKLLDISTISKNTIDSLHKNVTENINFENNLDIQLAQLTIKISKNDLDSSFAQHYPKINFDAVYTKYDSDDVTSDYENTQRMVLSLKVPIYQGGYVNSKVTASKLNLKAANEDLKDAQENIQAQYDELLAQLTSSIETVILYKDTLESTKLYLDSVSLGYQNGLKSIIDLNDASYKLHEVEYKYIENLYTMMDSYIGLLILTNNFDKLELLNNLLK